MHISSPPSTFFLVTFVPLMKKPETTLMKAELVGWKRISEMFSENYNHNAKGD